MLIFKLRYYSSTVLTELNARFALLKQGMRVIELGSQKGEWSRMISKAIGSSNEDYKLFSIDEIVPAKQNKDGVFFILGDVEKKETMIKLQKALQLQPVDLVISNLESRSQGDRDIDNFQQIYLNKIALNVAIKTLKTGGTMVIKARNGEPEENNYKFIRLFFKDLIKISSQTASIQNNIQYYLGLGFKQREEYLKYPNFFKKVLSNQDSELLEEEIPPSFQTQAERDVETLEFLEYASKHQVEVPNKMIQEIKDNERYKNINWEKYPLNIVNTPLTDYQEQMLLIAKYNGRLSFSPNTKTVDEDLKEGQDQMDLIDKILEDKKNESSLLEEGEILGQDKEELTEEMKIMQEEIKQFEKDLKNDTFSVGDITEKDMKGFNDWVNNQTTEYLKKNYPNEKPNKIIEKEIAKGNISREEIRRFYKLNEKQFDEKANQDYEYHITRNTEKISQQMTKEHRQSYYAKKKQLKTRRQ